MTAAHDLKRHWLERALASAGIDGSHWDPARGADENRRTIEAVYGYYGSLYLRHPFLRWAGMASLIGPSFYAGFLDVGAIPDGRRRLLSAVRRLLAAAVRLRRFLLRQERAVEALLDEGLGFFEVTFLTMQRKIFEDQAPMHEAYLAEGVDGIRAFFEAGAIDRATLAAWEQIEGGADLGIDQGNRGLLFREQYTIIEHFYARMRSHGGPAGWAFTYLITLGGAPSIPGARSFARVFPVTWRIGTPRPSGIRTPFPDGNIAVFSNRWKLIETDTLPSFRRLIGERGGEARALVTEPIAVRVRRYRLIRRLGRIVLALLTGWRIDLRAEPGPPRRTAVAEVTIDLRTPPPEGHRSWAAGAGKTLPVTVLLPGGREYRADAQLAVLLGGNPARLAVKGPATDLETAHAALEELAREWRIDVGEIRAWHTAAAAVRDTDHAYSTHVFCAAPIDHVLLELQVEHHVAEHDYVISALFSWDGEGALA